MKTKKLKRRIISLVLVVTIVFTGYGVSILADTTRNNIESEKTENVSVENVVTPIKEIKSERTANSNTYLMSDGSKKLEIYSEAIRYKEDGKWVDYDASLINLKNEDEEVLEDELKIDSDNYVKVNTKGDIKQYFPKKLNEDGIVMNKKNYAITLAPIINETREENELANSEILWKQSIDESILEEINPIKTDEINTTQPEETAIVE